MTARKHRSRRLVAATAVPIALLGSAALVWQGSYAAFSATTVNGDNGWTTGAVSLTDDDGGTALFDAKGLTPGDTGERCIVVTNDGSLPGEVALFGTDVKDTNKLSTVLDITVEAGVGGSAKSCDGFKAQDKLETGPLSEFPTNREQAAAIWSAPIGESRTYKFTYTLDKAAGDAFQDSTASVAFTWELRTP